MFNTMKKITGLVRSGALKNQFEIIINFVGDNLEMQGKKTIYNPKDSVMFLKDLMAEVEAFDSKEDYKYNPEDRIVYPKIFSILNEDSIQLFTQNETAYCHNTRVKTLTIIASNGKEYIFNINRKARGASNRIARLFKLNN